MRPKKHRRRIKLIRPRLQLKLVGSFVGLAALAMLLQFILLGARLTRAASDLSDGGGQLADLVPGMLLSVLAISCAVLLPIIFAFGVLITFRVAGPVYRFETYLGQVARGEDVGPCRIRKDDELHDLCDRINEAVSALRERQGADEASTEDGQLRSAG